MTIPYYRETMGSLDPWTNVHKFINWGHSAGNGSLEDDLNDGVIPESSWSMCLASKSSSKRGFRKESLSPSSDCQNSEISML